MRHYLALRRRAITLALALSAGAALAQTPLSEPAKRAFADTFRPACVAAQRSQPGAEVLPPEWIAEYCACAARFTVDTLTAEDLQEALRSGNHAYVDAVAQAGGVVCLRRLARHWGG